MTKQMFLSDLAQAFSVLPEEVARDQLDFHAEMIDDRMEDGMTEQEAVAAAGSAEDILAQLVGEMPLSQLVKRRVKPRRRLYWTEILLLALGSPVWVSLLLAAAAVVSALYASCWAVIVSCWAVFASFVGCGFGGVVGGVALVCSDQLPAGLCAIAAALVSVGLAVLSFYGCKGATKAILCLSKQGIRRMKCALIRKEARV